MEGSFEDNNSMTHVRQLLGYDKRRNDVIYVLKSEGSQSIDSIVVFFGGDIQVSKILQLVFHSYTFLLSFPMDSHSFREEIFRNLLG